MKKTLIMGVALAALSMNVNAQFAIENNANMGAKVTESGSSKKFSLDFSSDTEVGKRVQIKGLYDKTYNESGETISAD